MHNSSEKIPPGDSSEAFKTAGWQGKYLAATLLSCAVLLAAFLSFHNLDKRSVWIDEAFSIGITRLDWSGFWTIITHREANMGLYFLLLKEWLLLWGDGESAARSLSAIFAVATVPIVYLIGKQMSSERAGITAALLLACNAFYIRFAQETRSYSLLLFLVSVSSLFFIRSMENPTRKNWALYCLTSILAVYSHFFAILVIVSHALSLPLFHRKDMHWRVLLQCAAVITSGILPLLLFMATRDSGQVGWIRPMNAMSIPGLFLELSSRRYIPTAFIYAVFLLVTFVSYLKKRNQHCSVLLVWLIVPIVFVTVLSLVKPLFIPRYFIISLPFFVLLTSLGLSGMNRRHIYWTSLAAGVLLSVTSVFCRSYGTAKDPDWRSATGFIMSSARSGDAIIFYSHFNRIAFEYYRNMQPNHADLLACVYPEKCDLDTLFDQNLAPLNDLFLLSLRKQYRGIWLVLCYGNKDEKEALKKRLGRLYNVKKENDFNNIRVVKYSD